MSQITNHIMMIRPVAFRYNEQTATNNYYQRILGNLTFEDIQNKALLEFNNFVDKLRNSGVNVVVFSDTTDPETPDSIFPNNWISFHSNSTVCLYPMYAENRRQERRKDILDSLVDKYSFLIESRKDFTDFESEDRFLEGTGSMVLDRKNKICYAALSIRTNKLIVLEFCNEFGYKPVLFTANQDVAGKRMRIYHTNVMMCVADSFAIICLEAIDNQIEKECVIKMLTETGKEIIEITEDQKNRFAGNMLQIMGDKSYLVMSTSAHRSLTDFQKKAIKKHCSILHSSLDTIEACGGGSARCMIAEIFLLKE